MYVNYFELVAFDKQGLKVFAPIMVGLPIALIVSSRKRRYNATRILLILTLSFVYFGEFYESVIVPFILGIIN